MRVGKTADGIQENRKVPWYVYVILLTVCIASSALTSYVARSDVRVLIGEKVLIISSLTGVFSSVANICAILLVVFFDKVGFITAIAVTVAQFPGLIIGLVSNETLNNLPGVFSLLLTIMVVIVVRNRNKQLELFRNSEVEHLRDQQKLSQKLFEQTATALVNAVDAKDTYSHGHSLRVAEYSERIAGLMGKNDDECYKIYYAALLHDVGKIGIDDAIITKKGRLTDEEYEIMKQHPVLGNQILSSIGEYPYLSIGAHFHHERYDGKGYPDGLKGEDIPEIARIISVADAYDAMTSNRSYRQAIPQQLVREEIVKGSGTQFDPKIAKIMQHIIDLDTEYKMRERSAFAEFAGKDELVCGEFRDSISDGILTDPKLTKISLRFTPNDNNTDNARPPAIVLFDSLDARYHDDEKTIKDLYYFEYCEIGFDGKVTEVGCRKTKVDITRRETGKPAKDPQSIEYSIESVKVRDHVLITIDDGTSIVKVTVALPDSSRFAYLGLTGENCLIDDVQIDKSEEAVPDDYIPRIAEEISFIDGPVGDVPNIQIDGYRTSSTQAIPVVDGLSIVFHTMSLPTARLVWHCPFIVLFYSSELIPEGKDYKEFALIRIDGESWQSRESANNRLIVNRTDEFDGWDAWKEANHEGFDCTVSFERKGDVVVTTTQNCGLFIRNITTVVDGTKNIYACITGDQVALTNIRIKQSK